MEHILIELILRLFRPAQNISWLVIAAQEMKCVKKLTLYMIWLTIFIHVMLMWQSRHYHATVVCFDFSLISHSTKPNDQCLSASVGLHMRRLYQL